MHEAAAAALPDLRDGSGMAASLRISVEMLEKGKGMLWVKAQALRGDDAALDAALVAIRAVCAFTEETEQGRIVTRRAIKSATAARRADLGEAPGAEHPVLRRSEVGECFLEKWWSKGRKAAVSRGRVRATRDRTIAATRRGRGATHALRNRARGEECRIRDVRRRHARHVKIADTHG